MSVYLDVPFVSQLSTGTGWNDPTGCWYASVCMIGYHFEVGPRYGVPELFDKDKYGGHLPIGGSRATKVLKKKGVDSTSGGEKLLAEREHLEPVPKLTEDFKLADLEMLLRNHGPIYFAWFKTHDGNTYGHISVLIGTDDADSEVIYHDPENAANSRMKLKDLRSLRMRGTYDMLRKKGVVAASVRIKPGGS